MAEQKNKRAAAANDTDESNNRNKLCGENPIFQHARCNICDLLLYSRLVLPCAHACCFGCTLKLLENQAGSVCCPLCRVTHDLGGRMPTPDLVFRVLLEHAIECDGDEALKNEWREQTRQPIPIVSNFQESEEWPSFQYVGTLGKHNKPEGQGRAVFKTAVYEGRWEDGIPRGQGKTHFTGGDVYDGHHKDGAPNGQGKMIYSDGDIYKGNWEDGLPQGQGKTTFTSGDVYEGQHENGIPNGQGKMIYACGNVYEGCWENGRPKAKAT